MVGELVSGDLEGGMRRQGSWTDGLKGGQLLGWMADWLTVRWTDELAFVHKGCLAE